MTDHPTDSQAQQSWWESMTDDQREAYEDAIERERAEREVDVKVSAILCRDNVTEPGGEWSIHDVAGRLDPNAHDPSSMFDTGPATWARDEYVEMARASVERIKPRASLRRRNVAVPLPPSTRKRGFM